MQRTMMDEIFHEYETEQAVTNRLANEFNLRLSESEMHEFGSLFGRLKSLAQKGYNKARGAVVAGQIISKLLHPSAVDVAKIIEDQRNRHRDQSAYVEKNNYKDKPR